MSDTQINSTQSIVYPVLDEDALIDRINEWITDCQFSFIVLNFSALLFFIVYTKLCNYFLSHCYISRQNYNALDDIKKRKIIIYLSSIIIRVPATICVIYLTFTYWTLDDGLIITDCLGIQLVQLLAVFYSTLMIFELIKLPELSWDMWVHHMMLIIVACTLMDQSILDLPFRTDPYYVEITACIITGGSVMFVYQILWVYFHLLKFDKPTIDALRKLNVNQLKEIQMSRQASIENLILNHQSESKFLMQISGSYNTYDSTNLASQDPDCDTRAHATTVATNSGTNTNTNTNHHSAQNSIIIDGILDQNISANGTKKNITPKLKAKRFKTKFRSKKNIDIENGEKEVNKATFKTVDSVFSTLNDTNISRETLLLNRDSTKMKKNILKFRLYFLLFVISCFFGFIPFSLCIKRTMDNSYQKNATKWFLITMLSINICVEIYVFNLLNKIYKSQVQRYRKYKLALSTMMKRDKSLVLMTSLSTPSNDVIDLDDDNIGSKGHTLPIDGTRFVGQFSDNPDNLVVEKK